jgi:hypothetical protein
MPLSQFRASSVDLRTIPKAMYRWRPQSSHLHLLHWFHGREPQEGECLPPTPQRCLQMALENGVFETMHRRSGVYYRSGVLQ